MHNSHPVSTSETPIPSEQLPDLKDEVKAVELNQTQAADVGDKPESAIVPNVPSPTSSTGKLTGLTDARVPGAPTYLKDAMRPADAANAADVLNRGFPPDGADSPSSLHKLMGVTDAGNTWDMLKRSIFPDSPSSVENAMGLADAAKASDMLKRSVLPDWAGPPSYLKNLMGITDPLKVAGNLKESLERTLGLGRDVDNLIRAARQPAFGASLSDSHIPEAIFRPPPNPVFETNAELAELHTSIDKLVEIANRQSELSQAILDLSGRALQNAVASGTAAESASNQARRGVLIAIAALVVTVLAAVASRVDSHILGQSTDRLLHQQIAVLQEIARQKTASSDKPPVVLKANTAPDTDAKAQAKKAKQ